MALSPDFKAYLVELFEPIGPVTVKSMFGGAGVYYRDVMFALIAKQRVFLKVDAETKSVFEAEGLEPFVYDGKGKPIAMSYHLMPERAYDDPDALALWARRGIDAAFREAAKKKPKKQRGR